MQTVTKSEKILVVDDSEIIADALAMVLSAEGFHAVTAYSAQHALKLVMMPGMTGIELAIDVSKYPPAKPGALRCEPLKAA